MSEEDTRLKLADLSARLGEAHKLIDKIYGREARAVTYFGLAMGLLLSLFAGFQYANNRQVFDYVERAEARLEATASSAEERIQNALGRAIPRRVYIEDAIGDREVLEFAAEARRRGNNTDLRIIAPYYVVAEGSSGGLLALNYRMDGAFADFIADRAWGRSGALAELGRAFLRDGYLDTYYIQDHYTRDGFAILPSNQKRRFQMAFVFDVFDCEAAEALFEEMLGSDLGQIELKPVSMGGEAESASYTVKIMPALADSCTSESSERDN